MRKSLRCKRRSGGLNKTSQTCGEREKNAGQTELSGYPGYPAEPRPPLAPSIRTTRRQQTQLETHAVHRTPPKKRGRSSPSAASNASDRLKRTTGAAFPVSTRSSVPASASWSSTRRSLTVASGKPGRPTWTGLHSASSTHPFLSVHLLTVDISVPLSSANETRSSSGPISSSWGLTAVDGRRGRTPKSDH